MTASVKNSTSKPLQIGETFVGVAEDVGKYGSYTIAVRSSTAIEYKILQGETVNRWDDVRILQQPALPPPSNSTDTEPIVFKGLIKMKYIKVEIRNTEQVNQSYLRSSMIFRDAMPLNSLDDSVSVGGVDENGNKHLLATTPEGVLKTNTTVSVEDIKLDGTTDSIRIMGSTDQDVANIKLINTDVDGKLNINVDGTTQQLLTDILAKQALIEANIQKLEINANQLPISTMLVNSPIGLEYAIGDPIGVAIDMGTMETRNNDICFSGYVSIDTGFEAPKLIMQYSLSDNEYFGDGVECSFYKKTATDWEFNFQRNNVGPRYVRLLCTSPVKLKLCVATKFKN